MKILCYSPAFLPSIGGLEFNVANIAAQIRPRADAAMKVIRRAPWEQAVDRRLEAYREGLS